MTTNMTIHYYIKTVYGKPTMYIVEQDIAKAIGTLTGRKILIKEHKEALEQLGFAFEQVIAPLQ